MATQVQQQQDHVAFVRRALRSDGIFSTACGIFLTVGAGAVSSFIGLDSSPIILLLGLVLLVYGAGLFWLASSRPIDRRFPITVIGLNIVWIVLSALLLIADPFGLTVEGKWTVLIVADIVGSLAIWQFIGLRRWR